MFINKTTFLLGAGASWHYGYPTGEDLVRLIRLKAKAVESYFKSNILIRNAELPRYIEDLLSEKRFTIAQAWEYAARECETLAERLHRANPPVIDYFLGHNEDLRRIGKMLIACVILECNAKHQRDERNGNRKPNEIDPKDDWGRFILYKLLDGRTKSEDLLSNNVTFITFNYDVSLEEKIFAGLSHTRLFEGNHIDQFMRNGRFFHVYGSVRECPPLALENLELFCKFAVSGYLINNIEDRHHCRIVFDVAYELSKRIKTIAPYDKGDNDTVIKAAQETLESADCVYILGYGFDRNNNERLGLYDYLRYRGPTRKAIMFTNYEDRNQINKRASKVFYNTYDELLPDRPAIRGTPGSNFFVEKSTRNVYDALSLDFDDLEAQLLPTTPI